MPIFKIKLIIFMLMTCLLGTHSPTSARQNYHILILGDSLSSGLGVEKEQAYPSLILEKFKKNGLSQVRITNGSISGSTTAGALSRLKWFQRIKPDMVILALGANDGLRGLSTDEMFENLESSIVYAKKNNMTIILAGMKIPPNYGREYAQKFEQVYTDLVLKHDLAFIPFLLEGVAGVPSLNQADGIHPNAEGHKIMARTVYAKIMEQI